MKCFVRTMCFENVQETTWEIFIIGEKKKIEVLRKLSFNLKKKGY